MDQTGRKGGQPDSAAAGTMPAAEPGSPDVPAETRDPGTAPEPDPDPAAAGGPAAERPAGAAGRAGANQWTALAERPVAGHLLLLASYVAAGIALTWPLASQLGGRLARTSDVASYVWDMWWIAHQVVHLGNPWFTSKMAAPVGIQLGLDTTMPLAGLIMTPVTLIFGPSASFNLLSIVMPGLLCYVMYRAARLWLRSQTGAIAAGAFFGLSAMLTEQDWAHLNIAAGTVFLPMTIEAAVRLRRQPGRRQAIILGLVVGGCLLVNQESAVMAALLAALLLVPWLIRHPQRGRLVPAAISGAVAVVVASPQLVAMAAQYHSGETGVTPHLLAVNGKEYGVSLGAMFGPVQRVGYYGLHQLAAWSGSSPHNGPTAEGMPMFGVALTILAFAGLIVSWRRRSAWQLAALWLGCAWLALGATFHFLKIQRVPFHEFWNGVWVSPVMPYTWVMRLPVLSAFREADRFAILGLVGAALLAGAAVEWLRYNARPLIAVVAVLGALEAGASYGQHPDGGTMPTALPAVDGPIAADHTGSIVLDVPFGLRGGIPQHGKQLTPPALVLATADEHPRSIAYTSWIPQKTADAILAHAFYAQLIRAQSNIPLAPARNGAGNQVTAAQIAAARSDLRRLDIGWALVWVGTHTNPPVGHYLTAAGFRFDYQVDGVMVFRYTASQ